jgi:hypothetical protein
MESMLNIIKMFSSSILGTKYYVPLDLSDIMNTYYIKISKVANKNNGLASW